MTAIRDPIMIDRHAVAAIDRLYQRSPKCLDVQALRRFVALHTGRNPYANGPLNPSAAVLADNVRLQAANADLKRVNVGLRHDLADARAQVAALCGQAPTPPKRKPKSGIAGAVRTKHGKNAANNVRRNAARREQQARTAAKCAELAEQWRLRDLADLADAVASPIAAPVE